MGAQRTKGRGLPKRKPTTSFYDVKVADDDEIEAAQAAVTAAHRDSTVARLTKDAEKIEAAQAGEEAAKARLDACFERIVFTEIRPSEVDELLTKHPHPDADEFALLPADWQWPFIHHLAAASAVGVDQSPDEWAAWTDGWSTANWREFRDVVQSAQTKTATGNVPKG